MERENIIFYIYFLKLCFGFAFLDLKSMCFHDNLVFCRGGGVFRELFGTLSRGKSGFWGFDNKMKGNFANSHSVSKIFGSLGFTFINTSCPWRSVDWAQIFFLILVKIGASILWVFINSFLFCRDFFSTARKATAQSSKASKQIIFHKIWASKWLFLSWVLFEQNELRRSINRGEYLLQREKETKTKFTSRKNTLLLNGFRFLNDVLLIFFCLEMGFFVSTTGSFNVST